MFSVKLILKKQIIEHYLFLQLDVGEKKEQQPLYFLQNQVEEKDNFLVICFFKIKFIVER